MSRGLKPRSFRDHRRYDFHRTFKELVQQKLGAGGYIPDFVLSGFTNPDQNAPDPYWGNPALPEGCTGFAQAHIAESDLKAPVDPKFIYDKTLIVSGGKEGDECTVEDSFRAATDYGVRLLGETDAQALTHRMAPRFEVLPTAGRDWFDAIASALYANQRPVSVGTTWPPEFEAVGADGLQSFLPSAWVGGHDHCFIGKKTISGEERLVDISWNGEEWGDHGLSYFTRAQVNAMMGIRGSDCLTSRVLQGEEVKTVWLNMLLQLQLLELTLSLYQRLKSTLMTPPKPAPAPVAAPSFPSMIIKWSRAIATGEGAAPASHNPGNLKYSGLTASWGATKGRPASDGGFLCQFKDDTAGYNALCNFLVLGCENQLVAFHSPAARTLTGFTKIYAGNPPQGYIDRIIATLGVGPGVDIATFLA